MEEFELSEVDFKRYIGEAVHIKKVNKLHDRVGLPTANIYFDFNYPTEESFEKIEELVRGTGLTLTDHLEYIKRFQNHWIETDKGLFFEEHCNKDCLGKYELDRKEYNKLFHLVSTLPKTDIPIHVVDLLRNDETPSESGNIILSYRGGKDLIVSVPKKAVGYLGRAGAPGIVRCFMGSGASA